MPFGDLFVNGSARLGIGDVTFHRFDFEHHHSPQFGNLPTGESRLLHHDLIRLASRRVRPAQLFDEQPLKIKLLQAFASVFKVDRHIDSWLWR